MDRPRPRHRTQGLRIDLSTTPTGVEILVWTVSPENHHTVEFISEYGLYPGELERVLHLVTAGVREWWRPTLFAQTLSEWLEATSEALASP